MSRLGALSLLLGVVLCFGVAQGFSSPMSLRKSTPEVGVRGLTAMAGQEFKGFGDEKKVAPKKTSSDPKVPGLSKEEVSNMVGGSVSNMPAATNTENPTNAKKVVNRQARADPVNLDGGAMLDVGWVKKSFDTVMSEEWKKSGKEERLSGEGVCQECGGTGRIQGGLGAIALFEWWPIKAFRPCPTCEAAGRSYSRRGQVLDEVLFGSTDMPVDYEVQPDNRGLSAEDVKRIMKKKEKKPPAQ